LGISRERLDSAFRQVLAGLVAVARTSAWTFNACRTDCSRSLRSQPQPTTSGPAACLLRHVLRRDRRPCSGDGWPRRVARRASGRDWIDRRGERSCSRQVLRTWRHAI